MSNNIQYGGTWYSTLTQAARAWSATALPDTSVVDRGEDPTHAAKGIESYWYTEASKLDGDYAPAGVHEDDWRQACRDALESRIRDAAEVQS